MVEIPARSKSIRKLVAMKLIIKELVFDPSEAAHVPDDYAFAEFWRESHAVLEPDGYKQFVIESDSGEEVARFELDLDVNRDAFIASSYPIPADGKPLLEIQFIDVRSKFRGSGVGAILARHLVGEYPERQLFALAKESAEEFWEAVGWTRVRPTDATRQVLFLAPPLG